MENIDTFSVNNKLNYYYLINILWKKLTHFVSNIFNLLLFKKYIMEYIDTFRVNI